MDWIYGDNCYDSNDSSSDQSDTCSQVYGCDEGQIRGVRNMIKKFFKNTFRLIGALLALVRGVMILGMLVIGISTAYLIYTTAQVTVNQYNETLTWKNTAYDIPLADIEPALVSNVVDTDIVTAAASWEALENYVAGLSDGPPNKETAQAILDDAVMWQEKYGLQSDSITRLSLYLEMEDAITDAYSTLDSSHLQELAQTLHNLELEEMTPTGQYYMERLKTVASDFTDAQDMMVNVIGSIGTLKNGVWTIPYTYTRTELADALEQINAMKKFPALGDTANVLSDIADVLNYNKNARDYFEYQAFSDSVAELKRSDYVAVSSIYTYEQALSYGFSVIPHYQTGYTVSYSSPVTGVYYNGERLGSNEYVRKGAPITVEIDEVYVAIPDPDPQLYEIPMEEGIIENE